MGPDADVATLASLRSAALGEHFLHAPRGLAQALLVLDQRDADEPFAFLAEANPGRDRDMGVGQELLCEFHRAEIAEFLGDWRQANIEASGTGIGQPARPKLSTSTSRRFL